MAAINRNRLYLLIALLVILLVVVLITRSHGPEISGVSSAGLKFQPLNVQDPAIRLDLLDRIHKQEYGGIRRNIFSAEAPPPIVPGHPSGDHPPGPALPPTPSGPPPVEIPATFFGFAMSPQTGKRQAFFTNGDDVFVVAEGELLLNRFRVVKIGNNTIEMEEVSSGRHVTLTLDMPTSPPS